MIILNKPKDMTSNDCLAFIKKYLHPKKIGHTGTLDKNATGVLICLLGNSTKSQDYLMKNCIKTYRAELLIGVATDTEDISGNVISESIDKINNLCNVKIENVVKTFIGNYKQTPPMYSSKKVNGKKLLNLARKGITINREAVDLKIYNISIDGFSDYDFNDLKLKCVNLTISCSKGTYIRTLCKDIGIKLGLSACMGNLCRIASGNFNIAQSITLEDMKEKIKQNDFSFIQPCFYNSKETALTFGKFETLHLGHMTIIRETVEFAKRHNILSTVMIVGDNKDSCVLSCEQRVSKLKYLGVDNIIYYPLDNINKKISANSFVKNILNNQLKTKAIFVGSDCRFGYNGEGDSNYLKKLCEELNIYLKIIDKLKVPNSDIEISSTFIKSEFNKGNVSLVNELIGK